MELLAPKEYWMFLVDSDVAFDLLAASAIHYVNVYAGVIIVLLFG